MIVDEGRLDIEELAFVARDPAPWIGNLTFFLAGIALLPLILLDAEGAGIGFGWAVALVTMLLLLWFPFAASRLGTMATVPVLSGSPTLFRLICLPAGVLGLLGMVLARSAAAWLVLTLLALVLCLAPLLAARLVIARPGRRPLFVLPILWPGIMRWIMPTMAALAIAAGLWMLIGDGLVAAAIGLLLGGLIWLLLSLTTLRWRPSTVQHPPATPNWLGIPVTWPIFLLPLLLTGWLLRQSVATVIGLFLGSLLWLLLSLLVVRSRPGAILHPPPTPTWLGIPITWPIFLLPILLIGWIIGQGIAIDVTRTNPEFVLVVDSSPATTTTQTTLAATSRAQTDAAVTTTAPTTTTTTAQMQPFWIVLSDESQYSVWGLLDDTDSVAYVILVQPRTQGCLLIQNGASDVDHWGTCMVRQTGGSSSPVIALYEAANGSMLVEIRNADSVNLTDEMGFAQSAVVSVWDAPVIPRDPVITIFGVEYTAIIP